MRQQLQNVKFFTQIKIWLQNFTPKTRKSRLICYLQRVYPRPPNSIHLLNILHLLNIWVWCTSVWVEITPMEYLHRIWAKCTGVWGNITPLKRAVFTKLYPTSKARMLLSKKLPQTSKKFTQINLPYLWHFATLNQRYKFG